MPKIDSVAVLIRATGKHDFTHAKTIVTQMIAHERTSGRENAARTLEHALQSWPSFAQMVELPYDMKNYVWSTDQRRNLHELYLADEVTNGIKEFLHERNCADALRDADLPVRNRILLAGPPGNGKTSLASAIANELGLRFLTMRMYGVIDSHMGDSMRNIGKVLNYASENECLLFIDEFESLGTMRGTTDGAAGREYDNVVATFLTGFDRLPDSTVLIAATNMDDKIDSALQRRFELKLWLDNPTDAQIARYVTEYQERKNIVFKNLNTESWSGLPWSRIEELCIQLHKELILGVTVSQTHAQIERQSELAV